MKSLSNGERQELTIISLIVILLVCCPFSYTYPQSAIPQTTQPGGSSEVTQRQWSEAKADFGKAISEALAHKEVNILAERSATGVAVGAYPLSTNRKKLLRLTLA